MIHYEYTKGLARYPLVFPIGEIFYVFICLLILCVPSALNAQYDIEELTTEEQIKRAYPCMENGDGSNLFSTHKIQWFQYTPPRFRAAYSGDGFISAKVGLTRTRSGHNLDLELWIDSPEAGSIYGSIPPGAKIRLQGLNKQLITLEANEEMIPDPSQRSGMMLYKGSFYINNTQWKWLSSSGVDILRLYWDNGYEEIPVYRVYLIKYLAECLENR